MNHLKFCSFLIISILLKISLYGQTKQFITLKEISDTEVKKNTFHAIKDNEANLNDKHIKRITISNHNIVILFYNKTKESYQPNLIVEVIDKYGIVTSYATESWIINTISPHEAKSHNSSLIKTNI
jgi:hypothetical protein